MFSDNNIKKANRVLGGVSLVYVYSMFAHPWMSSGFNWDYVHSVWHTWQSLNVGVLAFSSSVVAFNIAKYREERRLEREFIAERALLPQALNDLSNYLESSVPVLAEGYFRCNQSRNEKQRPLKSELPNPSDSYILIFQNCIRVADSTVGDHLAGILSDLQIHNARLISMYQSFSERSPIVQSKMNYVTYLFCLAKLQAEINQLFDFARGEAKFDNSTLTIEQFISAYRGLNIYPAQFEGLSGFTESWVQNQTNT